jgi:hypothetical protein
MSGDIGSKIRIQERLRKTSQGYVLYNVTPEPVSFMFGGSTYVIPPDGPWDGLTKGFATLAPGMYDGKLVIKHTYGADPKAVVKYRRDRARNRDAEPPVKDKLIVPAERILVHAMEQRQLYKNGVVFLEDDEAENVKNIEAAKAAWIEFRRTRAQKMVSAFHAFRMRFTSNPENAGQPAPAMDDRVAREQAWLDQDKLARQAKAKAHICECGYETDDGTLMEVHMKAQHPTWSTEGADFPVETEEPARRGPSRPRKTPVSVEAEAR